MPTWHERAPSTGGPRSSQQSIKADCIRGSATGILGFVLLYALLINPLTAWLNLASWVGLWRDLHGVPEACDTPQNIVIGGLFGAAPPLFGWTAVTNSIDGGGLAAGVDYLSRGRRRTFGRWRSIGSTSIARWIYPCCR